jgi:cell division protein FtsW (lipid II flippase)
MAAGGAPRSYMAINTAALVVGLMLLGPSGRRTASAAWSDGLCLAGAGALLATALLGTTMAGITRWVQIGPVSVQPSLMLLPAMVMAFARQCSAAGSAAMLLSALALASQPDRAGAAALAAGLMVLAAHRRDRQSEAALAAALAGFAITLVRADPLAPSPFVEQVIADAFRASTPVGVAMVAAAALLLLPARALPGRQAHVFAAVWLSLVLASVLGNYPTPLLGYGSSGIIGYLLCLAVL